VGRFHSNVRYLPVIFAGTIISLVAQPIVRGALCRVKGSQSVRIARARAVVIPLAGK
jgi:hypothetical protein